MKTVSDFSQKYGIPRHTLYAWLYRDQLERHGIRLIKISGVQFLKLVSRRKLEESYSRRVKKELV